MSLCKLTVHAAQVFMRPLCIMLRSLVDLSLDSAQGSSLLGTTVRAFLRLHDFPAC